MSIDIRSCRNFGFTHVLDEREPVCLRCGVQVGEGVGASIGPPGFGLERPGVRVGGGPHPSPSCPAPRPTRPTAEDIARERQRAEAFQARCELLNASRRGRLGHLSVPFVYLFDSRWPRA